MCGPEPGVIKHKLARGFVQDPTVNCLLLDWLSVVPVRRVAASKKKGGIRM